MKQHTEAAKKFYRSTAWRKCRKSYIATVPDKMCEHCHEQLGYIVDHIKEINIKNIHNPDVTLNHDNLQFLCLECHNTKTFRKYSAIPDGFLFNSDGDLEPIPPVKK